MEAQDAASVFFLKLWPRIEANKNRIIGGVIIVAVAVAVVWIFSLRRAQKEITAGNALTQLIISKTTQPDAYLKVAEDYENTAAGRRALLQGAGLLFDQNNFAGAQTQFQKFLDRYPDSEFFSQASLGVAACLDAQGKTNEAFGAYQRLMNGAADPVAANMAKFGLARIDEANGKWTEAAANYQDVGRANGNNSLGQDAMWHLMQLKNKMPAAPATSAVPFTMTPAATPVPAAPASTNK